MIPTNDGASYRITDDQWLVIQHVIYLLISTWKLERRYRGWPQFFTLLSIFNIVNNIYKYWLFTRWIQQREITTCFRCPSIPLNKCYKICNKIYGECDACLITHKPMKGVCERLCSLLGSAAALNKERKFYYVNMKCTGS